MSELARILNLDADNEIQVTLGGKPLVLTQQRRSVIDRILLIVHEVGTQNLDRLKEQAEKLEKDENAVSFTEILSHNAENWQRALPAFVLMFGTEPTDSGYDDLLGHLTEHLSFGKAQTVFDHWYELNEVRRFFDMSGNPLVSRKEYDEHLTLRRAELAERVEGAATNPA